MFQKLCALWSCSCVLMNKRDIGKAWGCSLRKIVRIGMPFFSQPKVSYTVSFYCGSTSWSFREFALRLRLCNKDWNRRGKVHSCALWKKKPQIKIGTNESTLQSRAYSRSLGNCVERKDLVARVQANKMLSLFSCGRESEQLKVYFFTRWRISRNIDEGALLFSCVHRKKLIVCGKWRNAAWACWPAWHGCGDTWSVHFKR